MEGGQEADVELTTVFTDEKFNSLLFTSDRQPGNETGTVAVLKLNRINIFPQGDQ